MVGLAVTPTTPSSSRRRLNWPETSCERSMLSYQTLWPCDLSCSNGFVIVVLLVGARCAAFPLKYCLSAAVICYVPLLLLLLISTNWYVFLTQCVRIRLLCCHLVRSRASRREMVSWW